MRDEGALKKSKSKRKAKGAGAESNDSSLIPHPSSLSTPSSLVSVVMGSKSDWETMQRARDVLERFEVPHECLVVSAHRTPLRMAEFAAGAEARGIEVIIAGAGGAAHLPGMIAAQTLVPVLGVPVKSRALNGLDSLLSIVQMPAGIPVGTLAIGEAGATNAALLAVAILANTRPPLRERLRLFRQEQEREVREATLK
jgi:5-(carboxyamino)imidazole ribonucleotide mutase